MKNKSADNFDEWLSQLVRTSLPFEIQRKIVQCETLTKKELNQFASVLILAAQAEALPKISSTAETCATVLELVRGIDRRQVEQGKTLHLIDLHTMPPIDGLEDLFKENTPVQRNMFVEGFHLLTTKQFSKPRSAAIAVFEDYQRRCVKGRYTNKESFCTQFARKWEQIKSIRRL